MASAPCRLLRAWSAPKARLPASSSPARDWRSCAAGLLLSLILGFLIFFGSWPVSSSEMTPIACEDVLMSDRPYLFYELTNQPLPHLSAPGSRRRSLFEDEHVYLHKWCPEHRFQKVLISTDAEYYKLSRQTLKPGQMPLKFNTPIKYGCPYDCGLCPDHEQHSCLTLVEITDQCNLACPICYSANRRRIGRRIGRWSRLSSCSIASFAMRESRMSCRSAAASRRFIREFFAILDAAKARPIKHLMVNTNGIKHRQDAGFAPPP